MECLNNGNMLQPGILSFIEKLSDVSLEVIMYWYNREGTSKCVLYREFFLLCLLSGVLLYMVCTLCLLYIVHKSCSPGYRERERERERDAVQDTERVRGGCSPGYRERERGSLVTEGADDVVGEPSRSLLIKVANCWDLDSRQNTLFHQSGPWKSPHYMATTDSGY